MTHPGTAYNAERERQKARLLEARARMGFVLTPRPVDAIKTRPRLVYAQPAGPKVPADVAFLAQGNAFKNAAQATDAAPRAQTRSAHATVLSTAYEYGFTFEQLASKSRRGEVALARHVAMFRVHKRHNLSLPQIGKLFGGRDHTTVLHGVRRIEAMIASGEIEP